MREFLERESDKKEKKQERLPAYKYWTGRGGRKRLEGDGTRRDRHGGGEEERKK